MNGRLDDVREVEEDIDGPGVDAGDECIGGGGVIDTDRCIDAMWIAGRARQKDEAIATGCGTGALMLIFGGIVMVGAGVLLVLACADIDPISISLSFASRFAAAFSLFLSLSRSLFSLFFILFVFSSLSKVWLAGTPFSRLVRTYRLGRRSHSPARTIVALRLRFFKDAAASLDC